MYFVLTPIGLPSRATRNQWIWSRTPHCLKPLSRFFFFGSDGLAKLLVDEWTQIFSNSIKFVISAFLDSLGRWLKAAFKLCARARCPLGTNANTPRYPLGTSVNTTYIQVPTLEFGHSDGDRLQGQVQCRSPRLLGHKSERRVRPCVHDIFSSSGGGGGDGPDPPLYARC